LAGGIEAARTIAVVFFLASGAFFFFAGTLGLLRMPDVFCRMHATTKCDTLGAGLVFVGLMIWEGYCAASANILLVLAFIWLTNPAAAHYMARSAHRRKRREIADSGKGED
jgi:multicomponent Na+:H+ antiporter subunit G